MIYDIEQGKTEELILRQCQQQRLPIPAAIANAPEINLGEDFFLGAYLELSTCRVQDGPIPWWALVQYAEVHDVTGILFEELMYIVRHLDSEMANYRNEKAKAEQAAMKLRTRGNGRK